MSQSPEVPEQENSSQPSNPQVANPYATPQTMADNVAVPGAMQLMYFTDGTYLYVKDNAELPANCVVTNTPVNANGWRKRKLMVWTPPWVWITILGGVLILLIVAIVTQKKSHITYSMSDVARKPLTKRRIIGFICLVLSLLIFVIGFASIESNESFFGLAILVGFIMIITSIVFFAIAKVIKPAGYKNGWMKLKGLSPDFLAQLPRQDAPF